MLRERKEKLAVDTFIAKYVLAKQIIKEQKAILKKDTEFSFVFDTALTPEALERRVEAFIDRVRSGKLVMTDPVEFTELNDYIMSIIENVGTVVGESLSSSGMQIIANSLLNQSLNDEYSNTNVRRNTFTDIAGRVVLTIGQSIELVEEFVSWIKSKKKTLAMTQNSFNSILTDFLVGEGSKYSEYSLNNKDLYEILKKKIGQEV